MVTTRSQDRKVEDSGLPLRSRPDNAPSSPTLKRPRTPVQNPRASKRTKRDNTRLTELDEPVPTPSPTNVGNSYSDDPPLTAANDYDNSAEQRTNDAISDRMPLELQQQSPRVLTKPSEEPIMFDDPNPLTTIHTLHPPPSFNVLSSFEAGQAYPNFSSRQPDSEGYVTAPTSAVCNDASQSPSTAIDVQQDHGLQSRPTTIESQADVASSPPSPQIRKSFGSGDSEIGAASANARPKQPTVPEVSDSVAFATSRMHPNTIALESRQRIYKALATRLSPEVIKNGLRSSSSLARYKQTMLERHKRTPFWTGKKARFIGVGTR